MVHIEAAGSDVCGHDHLEIAPSKAFHDAASLRLGEVAMQFGYGETVCVDGLGEPLGGLLCA